MSEDDEKRIAELVADEMERRDSKPSPRKSWAERFTPYIMLAVSGIVALMMANFRLDSHLATPHVNDEALQLRLAGMADDIREIKDAQTAQREQLMRIREELAALKNNICG